MKKTFIHILAIATLASCSNKEKEPVRAQISDFSQLEAADNKMVIAPLQSSLETENTSACERLNELAQSLKDSQSRTAERFSIFSRLKKSGSEWDAYLDISESPFVQFIIGEKFKLDSEEEFYKKAQAEYDAGRLSWIKWKYVNFKKSMGDLRSVQYSATNDKLNENFPGLFGDESPANTSLHMGLAAKVANLNDNSEKKIANILNSKVSLFPLDNSWASLASATKKSMAAATLGLKSANDKEHLCALVLIHQNFAQLLRLKGYRAPVIGVKQTRVSKNNAVTQLSAENPEFRHMEMLGSFLDMRSKESMILDNDDISQYDPSVAPFAISESISSSGENIEVASLDSSLAFMESLVSSFEATSPASPWIENYFLGDIQSPGKAILPIEANTLALGLLTIQFKNLAGLNIKKINAQGQALKDGEDAAGILLASDGSSGNRVKIRLAEVVRLVKVTAYLELALKNFIVKGRDEVKRLNPGYTDTMLLALLGKNMFSESDLDEMVKKYITDNRIPESVQDKMAADLKNKLRKQLESSSMIDSLRAMKFPLAVLMSKLGTNEAGCVSEMNWDLVSGQSENLAVCDANDKKNVAEAFRVLGRSANSSLLMKKAEQIR